MSIWTGDAWGGAWGHTWSGSWGLTFEAAQDLLEYHGGGKRRADLDDERLHREHWDYIESLKAQQARDSRNKDTKQQHNAGADESEANAATTRAMRGKVDAGASNGRHFLGVNELAVLAALIDEID